MEHRINQIISEENSTNHSDTFADRADAYYRRRPRLISLLHDLYNDYVSLSDRYSRALTKLNTHTHKQYAPTPSSFNDNASFSDAESTISFHTPQNPTKAASNSSSTVHSSGEADTVAELVMRNVECEFLKQEMEMVVRESGRKIELQGNLVEVLEAERMVLLGENSRLVYKAEILAEERNAAFNENAFLRSRVSQLGKGLMRLEEERRGVGIEMQIEDLRRQVYALEMKSKGGGERGPCVASGIGTPVAAEGRKWSGLWRRLRKIGTTPCGSCMSSV